jgi:hypothetical protein
MAREAKEQRLAREAAENAAYEAEQKATYPQRLMAMLERATKVDFELTVQSGWFVVTERNNRDKEEYEFSLEYGATNESNLEGLGWDVRYKEQEQEEAQRKYQLRQNALAKLSKEEREELGV